MAIFIYSFVHNNNSNNTSCRQQQQQQYQRMCGTLRDHCQRMSGTFHEICRRVPCAMFHRNIAGMFQEGSYVRTGGTSHGNPHGTFLQASGNGVCCMGCDMLQLCSILPWMLFLFSGFSVMSFLFYLPSVICLNLLIVFICTPSFVHVR